jgi:prepilin peptidase CpaA
MNDGIAPVLIFLVLAGAWSDVRTRKIPNWIPVSGVVSGLLLQSWHVGAQGAMTSIAGAALGFGIFVPMYILGGMGAGDVKLFSAVGALIGPQSLVLVFVLTGLLGGVAAVLLAVSRGRLRETLQRTGELMLDVSRLRWQQAKASSSAAGALRLPYGAVIAGGTLLALIVRH